MGVHFFPLHFIGGILGVDVFFVLSGFLITVLLLQEWHRTGAINLRDFYLRRGLRLLPALILMLLLSWIYGLAFLSKKEGSVLHRDCLSILFYYHNWRAAYNYRACVAWLLHTWSLSVEEQFYILWPLILIGLLKLRVQRCWKILVVGIAITASAIWRTFLIQKMSPERAYNGTDAHADELLVGCLAGMLVAWDLLPKRRWALAFLKIAALAALLALAWYFVNLKSIILHMYYGGFTVFALAVAVVLIGISRGQPRLLSLLLACPFFTWIGRISYGLYLWHFPLLFWLSPYFDAGQTGIRIVVIAGASLAIATISFYCLEQPILRLKGRIKGMDITPVIMVLKSKSPA